MDTEPLRIKLWNLFNLHRAPCTGEMMAEAMTLIFQIERSMGVVSDGVKIDLLKLAEVRLNAQGNPTTDPTINYGAKIYLIKLVREHTQMGLKEAKDAVESGELKAFCVSQKIMTFLRKYDLLT